MNKCPYAPPLDDRPCQGSLYRKIETEISPPDIDEATGSVKLAIWEFPYAVALSQECDLEQHYCASKKLGNIEDPTKKGKAGPHDKILQTVLMCPAYPSQMFRDGKHLEGIGWTMEYQNSDAMKIIKQNNNLRYHFLAGWRPLQVAELVIDFKHFFTVPINLLLHKYATREYYFARLTEVYREDLSQRFAAYLSRIGLPLDHNRVGVLSQKSAEV